MTIYLVHSKLSLKIEFFEMELKSGAPLDAHIINKMQSLINQLALVHSSMIEDYAMAMLLNSMAKQYKNLVTTLKFGHDPSFEGIISALQEEGEEEG